MKTVLCAIGLVGMLLPGAALARPVARGVVSAPRAAPTKAAPLNAPRPPPHLIFGDDLVEAGRELGGGSSVIGRRPVRMSRLIPVRTDFVPELIKSAEDL